MSGVHSITLLAAILTAPALAQDVESHPPRQDPLAAALDLAGDNVGEIRAAVDRAPTSQRSAMQFLVTHMPAQDLQSLTADFLLEDVRLAFEAWRTAPWASEVTEELFLDAILPYAQVTETREPWRARLRTTCEAIVEGCATPGEAAQRLNRDLFEAVGVRYSTKRRRADQSPSESIAQSVASCTGLSILLADACRSVGVPARLAGIASWPNKPGNHTWVEVWDGERWRFTGAAEYSERGLDHAWFAKDAALATSDDPVHAIWAAVWRRTGDTFPTVWARGAQVHGIDVTERYAAGKVGNDGDSRLMVDVRDGTEGPRIAATVELVSANGEIQTGVAKDEGADTNDHLEFAVPPDSRWIVRICYEGRSAEIPHDCGGDPQQFVTVHLPPSVPGSAELRTASIAWMIASEEERDAIEFAPAADALVAADEDLAREIVWTAYRTAPIHEAARAEFDARLVRTPDREAPYTVRQVGERPPGGWALFIAMHGGGGVRKKFNDRQWSVMRRYYRDHPEAGGYLYVALRAPNDKWNGFYDDAICELVNELIRRFLLFGDVDPDKVFAMGYSHGGYGAFVIGSKIPDRFAAVHASAAAPTPGETMGHNLRNLTFSFMVGSEDTAYGRVARCDTFADEIEGLRRADPEGYPTTYRRVEGNGHTGLPDRDEIARMYAATRDPAPIALVWRPTDVRIADHFWITVPNPHDGQAIDVRLAGGTLEITTEEVGAMSVWLDRRLIGDASSLEVERDGEKRAVTLTRSARTLCESLTRRDDPNLAFPIRIEIPARQKS